MMRTAFLRASERSEGGRSTSRTIRALPTSTGITGMPRARADSISMRTKLPSWAGTQWQTTTRCDSGVGSSVGVSQVDDPAGLADACDTAANVIANIYVKSR